MSKPDTWMPLYIADYLADTMHLSTQQSGAYLRLLMASWMRGGSLPDDDRQLAVIVKASPAEWRRLRPAVAPFFEIADGVWRQGRLVAELQRAMASYASKSANGSKGGRPKKLKESGTITELKPAGFDSPNRNHNRTETQLTLNKNLNPPNPPVGLAADVAPSRFEEFWKAWPKSKRKVDRKVCEEKWNKKGLDAKTDEILAHVTAIKGSKQWQRDGFEPSQETYNNCKRWRDPLPPDVSGESESMRLLRGIA